MANNELTFDKLVDSIRQIHKQLASQAGRAVNISLTLRNWMFGLYIAEFELRGKDRAVYGDQLLHKLSKELKKHKISNTGRRQLYNYLSFFRTYPQIVRAVPAQSSHLIPSSLSTGEKVRTPSAQLKVPPERLLIACLIATLSNSFLLMRKQNALFMKSSASGATGRSGSSNGRLPAFIMSDPDFRKTKRNWRNWSGPGPNLSNLSWPSATRTSLNSSD